MKELLETLIKSQRNKLKVLRTARIQEYRSNGYKGDYTYLDGQISELETCHLQIINIYNQFKNDSESTTTK